MNNKKIYVNNLAKNEYINDYIDGMQKTRDPNSHLVHNAKTVIIDQDNNYYCFPVKLETNDLKQFIFEIAENNYTIFSDLEIVQSENGFYHYEYTH